MTPFEINAILVLMLCAGLCLLAYEHKVFTPRGTIAAFLSGFVIGLMGHFLWLLLLLIFLITSFAATKYKFALKQKKGVQEGKRGERRAINVFANGGVPVIIAVLSFPEMVYFSKPIAGIVFISALAVAAADTIASELGVLSDKTYLITNWRRRVVPGTNGGVSNFGHGCALVAAFYTAVIGWLVFAISTRTGLGPWYIIFIPAVVGFLGCQLDSLFGAVLETRGWINKHGTNFVTIGIGAIISWLVCILQGLS